MASWLRTNPSEEWWEQPPWQIDPILLVLPSSICKLFLTFKVIDVKKQLSFSQAHNICRKSHQAVTLPSQAALSNHMASISQCVLHQLFVIGVILFLYWFRAEVWNQVDLCWSLCHLLAVWPWARALNSLSFCVLIIKWVIPLQHPVTIEIVQLKHFIQHSGRYNCIALHLVHFSRFIFDSLTQESHFDGSIFPLPPY